MSTHSAPPRGEALAAALVQASRALIEAEGFSAFNLRAVTRAVGVTQPAVYRHFPSREALLQAVMLDGYGDFDRAAVAAAGEDEPYGRLQRLGVAYVDFAARNPGWFRLVFGRRDAVAGASAGVHAIPQGQALVLSAFARLLDPEDCAFGAHYRAWWGLVHGLSFLVIERVFQLVDTDEARVRAAAAAIAVHIDDLRARFGTPRPATAHSPQALFGALQSGLG